MGECNEKENQGPEAEEGEVQARQKDREANDEEQGQSRIVVGAKAFVGVEVAEGPIIYKGQEFKSAKFLDKA